MMRIAVFSDVHGNLTAFEAVLAAIDELAPDEIYYAGDLCFMGPQPVECLELLRERRIPAIYGNVDEALWEDTERPVVIGDDRWEWYISNIHWTRERLSAEQLDWLRRLPFGRRIAPSTQPANDLLIVHASPYDIFLGLFPIEARQRAIWKRVMVTDAEMATRLAGVRAKTIVFGHTHVPDIRQFGDYRLVNISSVSLPADSDAQAKFGLLTWTGKGWEAEIRKVAYDVDAYCDALRRSARPGWETDIEKINQIR